MKNQVLSIEQMQTLKDKGVDVSGASMALLYIDMEGNIADWSTVQHCEDGSYYCVECGDTYELIETILDVNSGLYDHSYSVECATFTVADLMEMLPNQFDMQIQIDKVLGGCEWGVSIKKRGIQSKRLRSNSLIVALFDTIIWLLDNNYELNKK